MKKRIISLTLALILTFALVPAPAAAAENFDFIIPDWVVEIDYLGRSVLLLGTPESGLGINADSYLEELGYDFKTPITLTIPNSVQEFDNGYENSTLRQKVVKVILSEGMTKIDRKAFCEWSNLRSVILPDSLIEIGENAFAKCKSLESIEFPKGLKNIEKGAFRGTALSQVVLPNGLESIGDGAFYGLPPLTDLTIPPSVVLFGEVIVLDPLYIEYHSYDFDGNFTTIHGVAGSSAEKYAKENKLPFSAITMPGVTPAPAPAQVQEPISFEQAYKDMQSRMLSKYNIKVVSDWAKSVDDVAYHESSVEIYMSMIPKELHNAVVAYSKARGKTLTIQFFVSDGFLEGTYVHESATIRLADSDTRVFLHELGHMLHRIVNEKYGSSKFSEEWTALNGGIPYGKDKDFYDDMDYEHLTSHFVSTGEYHMGNIGEDIAETFSKFSSEPGDGSHIIEWYGGANTWKKSELLNKAVSKALSISGIYNPYEPQAPSSWAIESVDKAFNDGENGGLIGWKDETPNHFTSPIKRADVCSYVMGDSSNL